MISESPMSWRLRDTIAYGLRGDRVSQTVRYGFTSQLIRVDPKFADTALMSTGAIIQTYSGYRSKSRSVGMNSILLLMVDCPGPYSLIWQPSRQISQGRVRFWEYILTLSTSDLHTFAQLENPAMPLFSTPQPVTSATATASTVAASTTSVELLPDNPARKGATLWNTSPSTLFIKLGSVATSTSYSFQMGTRDYYEVPSGYVGDINGIWLSASGSVLITELS